MKLELFFHIADLPGWEEATRREIDSMMAAGLWNQLAHVRYQLHYCPDSFGPFLEWATGVGGPHMSWRAWDDSKRPLGELYSIQDLHDHVNQLADVRAILRYHNKGITKLNTPAHATAQEWQRYYRYWCVNQWRLCVEAVKAGYNTAGANWHDNPGAAAHGHWSGNIWWARSDYLGRLPHPQIPTGHSQYGGFSPRHDAELWIGMDRDCAARLELHHHEHGCVYHVNAPCRYQL